MKLSNLLAVAVLGATSVALAQLPTQTTSTSCTGTYTSTAPCYVDGQTRLVAVYPEGLTLTVPNEIDFVLIQDQINWGNQPLTAVTTWNLGGTTQGVAGGYSELYVDAFFKEAEPLTPNSPSQGGNIPASSFVGSLNGMGGNQAFDGSQLDSNDPMLAPAFDAGGFHQWAMPVYQVALTSGATGNYSGNNTTTVKMGIDFTSTSAIYPGNANAITPSGTGTWAGFVYVKAMAY